LEKSMTCNVFNLEPEQQVLNNRIEEIQNAINELKEKVEEIPDEKEEEMIEEFIEMEERLMRSKLSIRRASVQTRTTEIVGNLLKPKLQPLRIPVFSGNSSDRPVFCLMFDGQVHSNIKLSQAAKFQYL
jgi:hypothetical protein